MINTRLYHEALIVLWPLHTILRLKPVSSATALHCILNLIAMESIKGATNYHENEIYAHTINPIRHNVLMVNLKLPECRIATALNSRLILTTINVKDIRSTDDFSFPSDIDDDVLTEQVSLVWRSNKLRVQGDFEIAERGTAKGTNIYLHKD